MQKPLPDPFPTHVPLRGSGVKLYGTEAVVEAFTARVEATRSGEFGGPLVLWGTKGTGRRTMLAHLDEIGPGLRALVIDAESPSDAIGRALQLMDRYQSELVEQVRRECPDLDSARRLGEIARRMRVVVVFTVDRPGGNEIGQWLAADRTAREAGDPSLLVITTGEDLLSYWRTHREPGDPMPEVVSMLPLTRDDAIEFITESFARALALRNAPRGTGISPTAVEMIADASGGFTDLIATYGNAAWRYYTTRPLRKAKPRHGMTRDDEKRERRAATEFRQGRPLDTTVARRAIDDANSLTHGLTKVVRDRQTALVRALPEPLYRVVRALAICGPGGATANEILATIDPTTKAPLCTDATVMLESLSRLNALGFTTGEAGCIKLTHPQVAHAAMHGAKHTSRVRDAEVTAPDAAGR